MSLLTIERLSVDGPGGKVIVRPVDLTVEPGEVVGLVGESGSGKTLTVLSLLGLLPDGVRAVSGDASLGGEQFLRNGRLLRRPHATMIFQDPTAALNPTMRIGAQIVRLLTFLKVDGDRRARGETLLESVGIHDPRAVMGRYPHQLSGGMNQRVMIAMAIAAEPMLLIADEPTTGLDVTVQAQILELIRSTVATRGIGVLFVSHDLGVIAQTCQRVAVMKAGEICELAVVDDIFHAPQAEYTRTLLASALDPAG
ncbi:ABC transporter ATP-binding protein [Micromonospora sp. WMMD1102]|uniref:ABC transporter ATP-binding protein n=1 Tax=Micromonospora sp. WMMD1102 TaxID=3016105 RepID=UPI0024150B99|nr:ABC transporter ATP-binding protein [Micromonospora sp. WMMD1102]MDG4788068.1 ABC transporter ATP-binding protein [Micromonospora sp. WMMD1102]